MNGRLPRAVVFDMDGVLVLSGEAHWVAWRETAAQLQRALTHGEYLAFNGMTNQDICVRIWGEAVTAEFVAAVADRKERAYRDAVAAAVPLAPGCPALLAALRAQGVQLAAGTSGPRENVDLVLDRGGIREHFGAVVHAGLVTRGKPAPDIFLRAAELLGVAPSDCVVVEDAPTGVRAALAGGMRVIGVASNHHASELFDAGARLVRPALADIALDDFARA